MFFFLINVFVCFCSHPGPAVQDASRELVGAENPLHRFVADMGNMTHIHPDPLDMCKNVQHVDSARCFWAPTARGFGSAQVILTLNDL